MFMFSRSFIRKMSLLKKNISIYSYNSLIILSFIYFMIHIIINGCYYGHYRTKLSRKYNILHNSRYDMFVHALPCVHQLSLCQEYNTVYIRNRTCICCEFLLILIFTFK